MKPSLLLNFLGVSEFIGRGGDWRLADYCICPRRSASLSNSSLQFQFLALKNSIPPLRLLYCKNIIITVGDPPVYPAVDKYWIILIFRYRTRRIDDDYNLWPQTCHWTGVLARSWCRYRFMDSHSALLLSSSFRALCVNHLNFGPSTFHFRGFPMSAL